jgi:hypothetical protein
MEPGFRFRAAQPADAFHTAMGFTVSGPVPDYDGPSTDRVLFERHLGT